MNRLLLIAALVASPLALAQETPKKPAAPKKSGAGWKVMSNEAAFPHFELTGGVGVGLPGLVWGSVGLETHQIVPLLYTDLTLRQSPAVFFGDLEALPFAQPLSTWGRARLGLTFETRPTAEVDFVTGYERVGKARVSKIFDVPLKQARVHEFYVVGEVRPVADQLTSHVGLGYGWETKSSAEIEWNVGAGASSRGLEQKAAYYIEPRALLGGPEIGFGLFFQTMHRVNWFFVPGFVNFELGAYHQNGFDFSAVAPESFAVDAMLEVGIAFDIGFGQGPLFFKPPTAEELARREKREAERKKAAAAKKAQDEAAKAKAKAEKAKSEAEKADDAAEKARTDAEKARTDAEKARTDAEKAEAEKAEKAEKAEAEAEKAEKAEDEAEKAKAEADAATTDDAETGGAGKPLALEGPTPTSVALAPTGSVEFVETLPGEAPRTFVLEFGVLRPGSSTDSVYWEELEVLRSPLVAGTRWESAGKRMEITSVSGGEVTVVGTAKSGLETWVFTDGVGLVRYDAFDAKGTSTRSLVRAQ